MAARDTERYYWLKLHKDFFKRHDITVIEDMPNGKDYVLFYLKLMLESIDHEGALRFSDTIPYSETMLASVTHTNVDVVRSALKILTELGMVEVFDDKTLFMTEVAKLLDSETYAAKRKRLQRENEEKGDIVPRLSPICPQDIETDIETETEKEKEIKSDKPAPEEKPKRKRQPFVPPTFEEVAAYCVERKNSVDPKKFFNYYTAGHWKDSRGDPVKNWKQKLITWERRDNDRRERDSQDARKGKPRGQIHYD
jgi:predicted phage replisome organizer